jgi:hypothetical protein
MARFATLPRMRSPDGHVQWLDANGIAEHLGYSVKRVHALTGPQVRNGIPYHRLTPNGRKMFDVREVDGWLNKR